ncbi:MAG TPA: M20 family metallopeptidase [Candidatus Acidoferrales bacterium]|nr:M20 family metallopeptidase [Candidatus Acidoferrales bacterium]
MANDAPNLEVLPALLRDLRGRDAEILRLIEKFVNAESPSLDKSAVDRFGKIVVAEWSRRGARVRRIRQKQRGDHLLVNAAPGTPRTRGQILLLGHLDTVYDLGTLERMPYRVSGGRAWGPGIFDMKGGLVLALAAVDSLKRCKVEPRKNIVCLWTSDEEIGSESSRRIIEQEARRSDAVLVLEPAAEPAGALKTARKGVGELEIRAIGRAAHSGLKPEEGINAVHELAMQIARISRWDSLRRGTGVHVDVIHGGTRTNVIAAEAHAQVDLRASRASEMRRIERQFRALRPILPGARLEIHGGFSRQPLERKMSAALFRQAQTLAATVNWKLQEAAVGGGSDGNFTAAIGVPTLDGLGAVGAGAHSTHEHIVIRELARRAALLGALMATL